LIIHFDTWKRSGSMLSNVARDALALTRRYDNMPRVEALKTKF
jgi:hypothetical protein